MPEAAETCCPRFDPEPWDEKEITWENRKFVKDRVRSFLHIPLNFPSVMMRCMAPIEAAGAKSSNHESTKDLVAHWMVWRSRNEHH